MRYTKPPMTFEDQAELLLERGLEVDREELVKRLSQVNYYRLSAYWYPFRESGSDALRPGTTLATVWDRYVFDRQLRVLTMDAIERVEVSVRTAVVHRFSLSHGAFGHLDRANLPKLTVDQHRRFLRKLRKEETQSQEAFIAHYHRKYTSETDLPLWIAAELMDFGCMFTLFRGLEAKIKQDVARSYGISDKVLESWLTSINTVRNICAHHGRLWNRTFGTPFSIPRKNKHPEWHNPVELGSAERKCFSGLTVLRYLLGIIAPQSQWERRLVRLLEEKHPAIPIREMGFPADWKSCPIWAVGDGS